MKPLLLTHAPLFDDLLTLDFGPDHSEDLHNTYETVVLLDSPAGGSGAVAVLLRRVDEQAEISLIFHDAVLLQAAGTFAPGATPDAAYRGRYELNGALAEHHGERFFYYLDFIEPDFSLVLAASAVEADLVLRA